MRLVASAGLPVRWLACLVELVVFASAFAQHITDARVAAHRIPLHGCAGGGGRIGQWLRRDGEIRGALCGLLHMPEY